MKTQEVNSYERKVQDAEEIDNLVGEAHSRSAEEGFLRLLLDHEEEPNIVRGMRQPFRHSGNEEITETRRRDGGLTWYHDSTKCLMLAVPDGKDKFRESYMDAWIVLLEEQLNELGYSTEIRREENPYDVDIYNSETGRQLVGLSGSNDKESSVVRACWYEEEPEVDHLLEADEEDVNEFYDSFETVEGLYSEIKTILDPENVEYEHFVSEEIREEEPEYLTRETGDVNGSCITGPQPAD